jgi:hypothetical protein
MYVSKLFSRSKVGWTGRRKGMHLDIDKNARRKEITRKTKT